MTTKSYRLLTTAIVSAIDPSGATARGAVWEPTDTIHLQEADALVASGYAEATNIKATHNIYGVRKAKTTTVPDNAKGKDKAPEGDAKLTAILEGSVPEVVEALDGLTADELVAIGKLEKAGKDRKGIANAIAEYDTSGAGQE